MCVCVYVECLINGQTWEEGQQHLQVSQQGDELQGGQCEHPEEPGTPEDKEAIYTQQSKQVPILGGCKGLTGLMYTP